MAERSGAGNLGPLFERVELAEELARQVEHHDRLYWEQAAPEISDAAYDELVERLRRLAPEHPVLQRVGGGGGPSGAVWQHRRPMLSLDKCYDLEGLSRWLDKVEGPLVETPKVDGVAAALIYDERGRLTVGATRGNGEQGEVATVQLRTVQGVPAQIGAGPLEVRGEVYLPLSRFAELAERFANPRNSVAGGLKQKDPERTRELGLRFFAYTLLEDGAETQSGCLTRLAALGFEPVPHRLLQPAELQASFEGWIEGRAALDYEIDGVVYAVDSLAQQEALGVTAHHPRGAIAYKLPSEGGEAGLLDVVWSVSRTGTLTPVGIIEPTSLSGAIVRRATLHNLGMVEKLGLRLGDRLAVVRRGGVIPKVERVLRPGEQPVLPPTECPSCGAPVERVGDFLQCPARATCPAQRLGVLEHYLKVMGVEGFGPALLEQVVSQALVAGPADLYTLRPADLLPLERMGETLARKLVEQIQSSRRPSLATFLVALGIPELGPQVARRLEERYGSLEELQAADEAALAELSGIGPSIAQQVVLGLRRHAGLIAALLPVLELQRAAAPSGPVDGALSGRSFVFTGELQSMKRSAAQALVRGLGATTPAGVRRDLDYLVVGGDPSAARKSSKVVKAEALIAEGAALRILSEEEFLALLPSS